MAAVPVATDQPGTAAAVTAAARRAFAAGRGVMVVDSYRSRAYFTIAAKAVDLDFMRTTGRRCRGVLWVVADESRLTELGLVAHSEEHDFRPSVGLHAAIRGSVHEYIVATLHALADPATRPEQLISPGHVFPTAVPDRVEDDHDAIRKAVDDLAFLSGLGPIAVACLEVALPEGEFDDAGLAAMTKELGMEMVRVRDLTLHRDCEGELVDLIVSTGLPTAYEDLVVSGYRGHRSHREYVVFATEGLAAGGGGEARVHIHRRCVISDVFGGTACECGEQLQGVIADLAPSECAAVIYFGEPSLQHNCGGGADEVESGSPAGLTELAEVAGILYDLGLGPIAMTSNMDLDGSIWRELGLDVHMEPEWRRGAATLARALAWPDLENIL